MPPRSAHRLATPDIHRHFAELQTRVFHKRALAEILASNRRVWRIPQSVGTDAFLALLIREALLREVALSSPTYPGITRYARPDASPLEIALSARPRAYLSHGTAVFLHALTEDAPRIIYVNSEQSAKPVPEGLLSQERIDLAFKRVPRTSNYVLEFDGYRVVLVSGKFTDGLEVGQLFGPGGERLPATKLERTLIDITVRPVYAGGVYKVLDAFRSAKDRMSVNTLVATLKRLEYIYPYHQALGFYMTRAGYEPERLALLRSLPLGLDFYLTHGIVDKDYDPEWRLYFPTGL